jgi:hypothetical protein
MLEIRYKSALLEIKSTLNKRLFIFFVKPGFSEVNVDRDKAFNAPKHVFNELRKFEKCTKKINQKVRQNPQKTAL